MDKCRLENKTENDLAAAFAEASNKFWCYAHDSDDEAVTEETLENYNKCFDVMKQLEKSILSLLKEEGYPVTGSDQREALKRFMNKNGFIDGNGWWIIEKEERKNL